VKAKQPVSRDHSSSHRHYQFANPGQSKTTAPSICDQGTEGVNGLRMGWKQSQLLIRRITGHLRPTTHFSGKRVNQDLTIKNSLPSIIPKEIRRELSFGNRRTR
jgi:hypothetical protein